MTEDNRSAITSGAHKLPIQVAQHLAGHSHISTTREYYLTVHQQDLDMASELLNKILSDRLYD